MGDGAATECGGSEGLGPWSLGRGSSEKSASPGVTPLSGFAGAQPRLQR
jgi:hypothetical protein